MARSPDYIDGYRAAWRGSIAFLHQLADEMADPHAKSVLNSAAFALGHNRRARQVIGEQEPASAGPDISNRFQLER